MGEPTPSLGPVARTSSPAASAALQELAQAFLAYEHASLFYPEGHQSRRAPEERLHGLLLAEARASGGVGHLGIAGESLFWRGELHEDSEPVVRKFAALLASQGIARLEWTAGLTVAELQDCVGRLARGRGVAHRKTWDEAARYEHLRVEVPDYQSLMAESAAPDADGRRLDLWRALLRRSLARPEPAPAADEIDLLRGPWEGPEALAELLIQGGGEDARSGAPAAVESVRRFTALVELAASGCQTPSRAEWVSRLGALGARLPPALRLRLLETALGGAAGDLFAGAFGGLSPAEGIVLLGRNFALDPAQIERLSRVFQHLVPRHLERLELAPRLREEVRRAQDPEEPLAENALEEVLELLTGEAGDFMSPAYREQLGRLAAREEKRRGGEAALAVAPELEAALAPEGIARASLQIQLEQLRLATGLEGFRDALEGLAGLCGVALAAGDHERGMLVLCRLFRLRSGDEPLAGPRAEIERALRGLAEGRVFSALASLAAALESPGLEAARALVALAPGVAAPVLLDAYIAAEDGARRRGIALLLQGLGPAAAPALLLRLEAAVPAAARALLPLVVESGGPAAAPALLGLLARDDQKLRRDALRALRGIDTPEVRRALPLLLEDRDEEIAHAAAAHLGAIGSPEVVREQVRGLSGGLFGGRRLEQAQRAMAVLGRMRAAEAVAPLRELLLRRAWFGRRVQEQLREGAAQALARIGGAEAKRALEEAAARGSGTTAATCRRLLARWGKG
ncbi:MAG TPA: HEAT repeat domain-containing protein [Candidatus Methanoperedens sp.]|nr:HEAT repeat domain-containing protein [Candidatus Methanoperedens sp.]